MTYDRTLKYQDYKDLALAQAGAIDRTDQDTLDRIQHLLLKGYMNVVDARHICLTEKGYDALTSAGFKRNEQREFFENYPRMLDDME